MFFTSLQDSVTIYIDVIVRVKFAIWIVPESIATHNPTVLLSVTTITLLELPEI